MREFDLRIPVANWLILRGLSPICEVQSLRNCDMIGVGFEAKILSSLVAVELKLSDIAGVLRQCGLHGDIVNETWAAMPPQSLRTIERFKAAGFGLLSVIGHDVSVIVPSPVRIVPLERWQRVARSRRNEHKWRMEHPQMLRFPAQRIIRDRNEAAMKAGTT